MTELHGITTNLRMLPFMRAVQLAPTDVETSSSIMFC